VSAHRDIEHSGEYRRAFGVGGSRSQFIYGTECEYQRSLRLAQARQHLPAFGMVPWTDLTVEEQEEAVLVARNWLRAAIAAGLMEDCTIH
jgi:hypothetical protein